MMSDKFAEQNGEGSAQVFNSFAIGMPLNNSLKKKSLRKEEK